MGEGAEVLVIDAPTVRRLLPMPRCIEVMQEALAALARRAAINPLRSMVELPYAESSLFLMPAASKDLECFGLKVLSVFPQNRNHGLETHHGIVMLFEEEHGRPLALVDASAVTEIRTAAVSGLATRVLARNDADDLAILGSGMQARSHLEAIAAVRHLRRVRAWSPSAERLAVFVADMSALHGVDVEPTRGPREAVEGAAIICTVTAARDPILLGEWIHAGAHINAVGSALPWARELDSDALKRSRLFVDRRESALNESGDILLAIRDRAIGPEHIRAELGDVLVGAANGRVDANDITVFESLGLAVEDLAAAHAVFEAARAEGSGTIARLA